MSAIQDHISHILKHGLARTNRFQVLIPLPDALAERTASDEQEKSSSFFGGDVVKLIKSFTGSGSHEVTRGLEMMVQDTSLPGKSLSTSEIKYNGDFYKLPYAVLYEEQSFVFHVSQDMYEKNIMDEWMNVVYDPVKHYIGFMDEFSVNLNINQLDMQDNIVYSIVLKDAFPINCQAIAVSNEDRDNFIKMSVTFAFRRWERVGEKENQGHLTAVDALSETPLGPVITPILSNPAVQRGLDFLENNTGIDLEGEAVAIYNQVDEIVKNTSGVSINKSVSLIESIKAATELNDKITSIQKAEIIDIIDGLLAKMK